MRLITKLSAVLAGLVAAVAGPSGHAAPVFEAGVHFGGAAGALGGYNTDTITPLGFVGPTTSSAGVSTGGLPQGIVGEARASNRSLGVRLTTELSGGYAAASLFEGVRFASQRVPTANNTLAGYSIGIVGQLDVTITQNNLGPGFSRGAAVPSGDPALGVTRLVLQYFNEVEDRASAVRGESGTPSVVNGAVVSPVQRLAQVNTVGTTRITYGVPTPTLPSPPQVIFVEPRFTAWTGPNCRQAPERCRRPGVDILDSTPLDLAAASFGLGLSRTAILGDELGTYGEIDAFNSFDLDGLVLIDPNGDPVDAVFRNDGGQDLTLPAFRDPSIALSALAPTPIPLPAPFLMLPCAVGALLVLRRRKTV